MQDMPPTSCPCEICVVLGIHTSDQHRREITCLGFCLDRLRFTSKTVLWLADRKQCVGAISRRKGPLARAYTQRPVNNFRLCSMKSTNT